MRSATQLLVTLCVSLVVLGCGRPAPIVVHAPPGLSSPIALLSASSGQAPSTSSRQAPSTSSGQALSTVIASRRAAAYLWAQYNPTVGLLRESPTVAPNIYWLATDNRLAVYAFTAIGTPETLDHARTISATLRSYDTPDHGLIEALQGQPVAWPPYVETQEEITTTARGQVIMLETRQTGARYDDWAEYADLAFYAALDAWNKNQPDQVRQRYASALALFDGVGFADKAYQADGLYATYKLALAVYVGRTIGETVNPAILPILLALQAPPCTFDAAGTSYTGGFYTLYDRTPSGQPVPRGDPNTETTAYAALALAEPGAQPIRQRFLPFIVGTPADPAQDPIQQAMVRGVAFLANQYNAGTGLLQESPTIHWDRYYLTNSNALAAYTLETLDVRPDLAATLRASLAHYGSDHNSFIEVAWGEPIPWPPHHHQDIAVDSQGAGCILQEDHSDTGYFYDWSAYANLAFMAVLNEHNQGYLESARRLYEIEMSTFDGRGWQDKAYWDRAGVYETIGPAWALYAGATIGAIVDPRLLQSLLAQQDPISGGFHTHYRPNMPRLADPNIETTCLALLGLNAYRADK